MEPIILVITHSIGFAIGYSDYITKEIYEPITVNLDFLGNQLLYFLHVTIR